LILCIHIINESGVGDFGAIQPLVISQSLKSRPQVRINIKERVHESFEGIRIKSRWFALLMMSPKSLKIVSPDEIICSVTNCGC
jgi:hypothetical protein